MIPTTAMVADALTKPIVSIILCELLTTGFWRLDCEEYSLRIAELKGIHVNSYEEKNLVQIANRPDGQNLLAVVS